MRIHFKNRSQEILERQKDRSESSIKVQLTISLLWWEIIMTREKRSRNEYIELYAQNNTTCLKTMIQTSKYCRKNTFANIRRLLLVRNINQLQFELMSIQAVLDTWIKNLISRRKTEDLKAILNAFLSLSSLASNEVVQTLCRQNQLGIKFLLDKVEQREALERDFLKLRKVEDGRQYNQTLFLIESETIAYFGKWTLDKQRKEDAFQQYVLSAGRLFQQFLKKASTDSIIQGGFNAYLQSQGSVMARLFSKNDWLMNPTESASWTEKKSQTLQSLKIGKKNSKSCERLKKTSVQKERQRKY